MRSRLAQDTTHTELLIFENNSKYFLSCRDDTRPDTSLYFNNISNKVFEYTVFDATEENESQKGSGLSSFVAMWRDHPFLSIVLIAFDPNSTAH